VYSAVIAHLYSDAARTAYIVADSTLGSIHFGMAKVDIVLESLRAMPEASPELICAYERANARPAVLEANRFHTRVPVEVLGGEELSRLREESMAREPPGYADSVAAREDLTLSHASASRRTGAPRLSTC
jgi:hypothetical protein